jgi:hypothetical protein
MLASKRTSTADFTLPHSSSRIRLSLDSDLIVVTARELFTTQPSQLQLVVLGSVPEAQGTVERNVVRLT